MAELVNVNKIFPWSDFGLFKVFFPNRTLEYQLNCSYVENDMSWRLNLDPEYHVRNNLLVLHQIFNALLSMTSLLFNIALMYLIHDRSGQVSRMRPLLKWSCALDIVLSLICFITGPFLQVSQGHFTTVWNGMIPTKNYLFIRFGISLAWTLVIGSWAFLPLQFVYRLDVIRHSNSQKYEKWKLYAYFAVAFFILLPSSILAFEMNMGIRAHFAWSASRVLRQYGLDVNMHWIAGGFTTDLKSRFYAHYFTATLFFGYLIIIYTELLRRFCVQRMLPTLNYASRRMHQDMNRTFAALALCPLFTSILPAMFINKAVNLCHVTSSSLVFLSLSVVAAPLYNATVTLMCVRPYRSAFLSWFGIGNNSRVYLHECPIRQQLEHAECKHHISLSTNSTTDRCERAENPDSKREI